MMTSSQSPKAGQYEYGDFEDVLEWIRHFTEVYGPSLGFAFQRYCGLRSYYLQQSNLEGAQAIENLIKNDVGVRRLREEYPEYFDETNKGRDLKFHTGKFLGWGDVVGYNAALKAVSVYEI